jgi:hypothetical protein
MYEQNTAKSLRYKEEAVESAVLNEFPENQTHSRLATSCEITKVPVVWREEDVRTKYGEVSSSMRRTRWSAKFLMDFLEIKCIPG